MRGDPYLGTPVAASVNASNGNAGMPELAQAADSGDEGVARLAAAGEADARGGGGSQPASSGSSISSGAERMNATLPQQFPATVSGGQSNCPDCFAARGGSGGGSSSEESWDDDNWGEGDDGAAGDRPRGALWGDSSDSGEEDDDDNNGKGNDDGDNSDEEDARLLSTGLVFRSGGLVNKPSRQYDEGFVALWPDFPPRVGDYMLIGVHETTPERLTGLVKTGPLITMIGHGSGSGKGDGFYITDAAPQEDLKKLLASVSYGRRFAAIYVHRGAEMIHGGARESIVSPDSFSMVRAVTTPQAALRLASSSSSSGMGSAASSSSSSLPMSAPLAAANSSSSSHGGAMTTPTTTTTTTTTTTSTTDGARDGGAAADNVPDDGAGK